MLLDHLPSGRLRQVDISHEGLRKAVRRRIVGDGLQPFGLRDSLGGINGGLSVDRLHDRQIADVVLFGMVLDQAMFVAGIASFVGAVFVLFFKSRQRLSTAVEAY